MSLNRARAKDVWSFALLLLSAVLFALSHPNPIVLGGVGLLAFVCFVPLLYTVFYLKPRFLFLYGFFYGAVLYLFLNYWLYHFSAFALFAVPVLKGLEWGFTFVVLGTVRQRFKRARAFWVASVITASFYLQECFFLGYPYGNVAYALYRHTLFIQVADLFGVWTLVFIIAFVNASILEVFVEGKWKNAFISAVLILLVLMYGGIRLYQKNNESVVKDVRIATVQHNADTHKGGYEQYRRNLKTLESLTLEALKEKPDVVVWSETSLVPSVRWHLRYREDLASLGIVEDFMHFARLLPVPLIFGNGDAMLSEKEQGEGVQHIDLDTALYYNSSMLIERGEIKDVYHKQHLVPFSEEFPRPDLFPKTYKYLSEHGFYFWNKGSETRVFALENGLKVFTPICFEDTFASIPRDGVRKGAECIINLTNDYWSLSKVSEMQHLSSAVFRSVENNTPTVRSTNSGASCYITANGEIKGLLPLFSEAYGVYDVEVKSHRATLYTLLGDVVIQVFTIIVLLVLFLKLTRLIK